MNEALRPDFLKDMQPVEEKESETVTAEEMALYSMAKSRGWKAFRKIADQAIKDLDRSNKAAIANGLSLEEIGKNTVVVSLAQEVIEKLLNKVSDAVDACTADEQ